MQSKNTKDIIYNVMYYPNDEQSRRTKLKAAQLCLQDLILSRNKLCLTAAEMYFLSSIVSSCPSVTSDVVSFKRPCTSDLFLSFFRVFFFALSIHSDAAEEVLADSGNHSFHRSVWHFQITQ